MPRAPCESHFMASFAHMLAVRSSCWGALMDGSSVGPIGGRSTSGSLGVWLMFV